MNPACEYNCKTPGVRCDTEHKVKSLGRPAISVLCTLPKGHAGKHMACALTAHCIATWEEK